MLVVDLYHSQRNSDVTKPPLTLGGECHSPQAKFAPGKHRNSRLLPEASASPLLFRLMRLPER